MSLAPQRPNFVLIWIGVVMLTFSLAGKWLMLEEPAGAKKHSSTSDIPQAGEPFYSHASASKGMRSGNLDPAHSGLHNIPGSPSHLPGREVFPDVWDFANHEDFTRAEGVPETLEEILAPTSEEERDEEVLGTAGLMPPAGTQPDLQEVHHALRPVEVSAASGKESKKSKLRGSGKLESQWAGSRYGKRRGSGKVGPEGPGQDVLVRTTVQPNGKGRLLVRFFLSNPDGAFGKVSGILSTQEQLDAQMARRASELLQSMDEAVAESSDGGDTEEEADRKQREHLENMQRKLVQRLQQRPGGVELVAELTPAQLEALMYKLSARSSKLRALIEG